MRKKIKTILILITIIISIIFVYFDSTRWSVNRVRIKHEIISSDKISDDLEGMQIAVFSDLHYNNFMNKGRLKKIIEKLNKHQPDTVIFLGDLYDKPTTFTITEEVEKELTDILKSITAPYGKFAVLGEDDLVTDEVLTIVERTLFASEFEIINNNNIQLSYGGNNSINLIGFPSEINGSIDPTSAIKGISDEQYNLVLMHTPDTFNQLDLNYVDLALAGHSHAGQAYLPFIGVLFKKDGALKYNYGTYIKNDSKLYVNKGLGTTDEDFRLFSDPEIIIYTLKKK